VNLVTNQTWQPTFGANVTRDLFLVTALPLSAPKMK